MDLNVVFIRGLSGLYFFLLALLHDDLIFMCLEMI